MTQQDTLYRITIDDAEYDTTDATLTSAQLQVMAALPASRLFFLVTPDGHLRRLHDGEAIDIQGHGRETFISRDPADLLDQPHYRLSVDDQVYETRSLQLSGLEIKVLAGADLTSPLYQERDGQLQPVSDHQFVPLTPAGMERLTTHHQPAPQVKVTVTYSTTGRSRSFEANLADTLQTVITEAYRQVGETPRATDAVFTGTTRRTDLSPYLQDTLERLLALGLIGGQAPHLALDIDIDAAMGGA